MIVLSTLKGERFALNEDLIEKVEVGPETRIILTTGTRYIVAESATEIAQRVRLEHAETQVLAKRIDSRARQLSIMKPREEGAAATRGDVLPFGRGTVLPDAPTPGDADRG
ncbi:MAG: flagellar FlbD family protein [Actinomycetota bacterium]|jgi:flagellar protein FlbD|nr:flagellar FlbD family protein [Actinomycetota bacterium]